MATRCLLAAAVAAVASASGPPRDFAQGSWSRTFFRPREVQIESVGLVNEDTAYVATRSGIKALRAGLLTPLIEVPDEEVKAFHLCHHRHSIFFEVLSRDGGALSIYEYSLSARQKVLVKQFQDAMPAVALACADQWLLRASPASLRAVHILSGKGSELRRFQDQESSNAISSLTVAYAADVVARAEVYAAVPGNRTVLRLRLADEGGGRLREEASETALGGGEGADGPLATATARHPDQLLWTRGQVLFTDGCSLRVLGLQEGRVQTLLGNPSKPCALPANETLEPVPWASRLSRPRALAASDEGTGAGAVLMLTEAQVVHLSEATNTCAGRHGDASGATQCTADGAGCGWAEGPGAGEQLCFQCGALERWVAKLAPPVEMCSLDLKPRAGTRYSLSGCGCLPPPPAPGPAGPGARDGGEGAAGAVQAILSVLLVLTAFVIALMMYRRSRRAAAMRELYGVDATEFGDTAEFHTFTDNECIH